MTKLKYLPSQFPDYDLTTLPPIPADWQDTSWGNDIAPSFDALASDDPADSDRLRVWVDYADPAQRQFPETLRYGAYLTNAKDERLYEIESDDWDVILRGVEYMRSIWPQVKANGYPDGY